MRHDRPLVGVGALIFTPDLERVLLIERGAPPARGRWSVPGGLVERGESLRAACARELEEETGVNAELRGEVKVLERIIGPPGPVIHHFIIFDFWGVAAAEATPVAASDVADARWVELAEVSRLPTTAGLESVVERGLQLARGEVPPTPLVERVVTERA